MCFLCVWVFNLGCLRRQICSLELCCAACWSYVREMLIGCRSQVEETQELAVKSSKGLGKVEWYHTLTLPPNPDLCGSGNNFNVYM
jgi:hypothetical protein